ncbi:10295_t:CDS:2, partial [Gigaspora rosea]
YGEPFSLYVFGSVRTYAGIDSIPEVLKHSDVFSFNEGANKIIPVAEIFEQFIENYSPSDISRVIHDQISGKLNIYTSRMQRELLYGIENLIGDCKVESQLLKMRFASIFLSFIHVKLSNFFATLPLKFGLNPITQHRDLFVKRCKPVIEERIHQRKELGEKYIQKEDLLDFYLNKSKADVVDNKLLNHLFGTLPELWNELYEEQLKIHNESNGCLSIEDVNKMVKLDCFLKESLRYTTDIASVPHTVIGDSYTFSRDVYLYMRDTSFSNKFYGETSHDFQPKRHITSYHNGKIVHSPAHKVDGSFVVFGGGKHACPGRLFAVNEVKMCLHKLILKYNFRTENSKIVPPIILFSVCFPPKSGLVFEN